MLVAGVTPGVYLFTGYWTVWKRGDTADIHFTTAGLWWHIYHTLCLPAQSEENISMNEKIVREHFFAVYSIGIAAAMGKVCTRATDCITASFQSYLEYTNTLSNINPICILNGWLTWPIVSHLLPKCGSNKQFLGLFSLKVYPWAVPSGRLGEGRTSLAFREWWC